MQQQQKEVRVVKRTILTEQKANKDFIRNILTDWDKVRFLDMRVHTRCGKLCYFFFAGVRGDTALHVYTSHCIYCPYVDSHLYVHIYIYKYICTQDRKGSLAFEELRSWLSSISNNRPVTGCEVKWVMSMAAQDKMQDYTTVDIFKSQLCSCFT